MSKNLVFFSLAVALTTSSQAHAGWSISSSDYLDLEVPATSAYVTGTDTTNVRSSTPTNDQGTPKLVFVWNATFNEPTPPPISYTVDHDFSLQGSHAADLDPNPQLNGLSFASVSWNGNTGYSVDAYNHPTWGTTKHSTPESSSQTDTDNFSPSFNTATSKWELVADFGSFSLSTQSSESSGGSIRPGTPKVFNNLAPGHSSTTSYAVDTVGFVFDFDID